MEIYGMYRYKEKTGIVTHMMQKYYQGVCFMITTMIL